MNNKVVEFLRTKDYKLVKEIGQGGTGKTVLLKDEYIDEYFVCKKYSPYYESYKDEYYKNFVNEIKILHCLYHRNIVRVYNYYLYPNQMTGYILMEYIDGPDIKNYLKRNPHKINEIFVQAINGFEYLESNGILHRDIRPENFLISDDGFVKIIDFGFGKIINFDNDFDNSISLNWRYTPPCDFANKIYDYKTEIYFIGKLFEEIIKENKIENFSFDDILIEMINENFLYRIDSFTNISRKILIKDNDSLEFSTEDIKIYQDFANQLISIYSKLGNNCNYINDIDKILIDLDNIYRNSMLETFIQNPNYVTSCFITGPYRFYTKRRFPVTALKNFLKLFKSVSIDKKRVILNNIWQRLDTVERIVEMDDELPF